MFFAKFKPKNPMRNFYTRTQCLNCFRVMPRFCFDHAYLAVDGIYRGNCWECNEFGLTNRPPWNTYLYES